MSTLLTYNTYDIELYLIYFLAAKDVDNLFLTSLCLEVFLNKCTKMLVVRSKLLMH